MGMHLAAPALGWTSDLTLRQWLKEDGDWVAAGNPICILGVGTQQRVLVALESGFLRIAPSRRRKSMTRLRRFDRLGFVVSPGESETDHDVRLPDLPAHGPWRTPIDEPALRAVAQRANPGRIRITPRASRLARQRGIPIRELVARPHHERITTWDVPAAQIGGQASPVMSGESISRFGIATSLLRWETKSAKEVRGSADRLWQVLSSVMKHQVPQMPELRKGAVGRVTNGRFEFREYALADELAPVQGESVTAETTIPKGVDWLMLDLNGLPFDWLELPGFNDLKLVIALGRVRTTRRRGRAEGLVESTMTVRWDTTVLALADITAIVQRVGAELK